MKLFKIGKDGEETLLYATETTDNSAVWWNYAERRYDRELKGSAYKQQHQPLGGFAAIYGGFASPPRY